MADVYHLFMKNITLIKNHTDRVGQDMFVSESDSFLDCSKLCESVTKCVSFVYDGVKCWLKSGIPPIVRSREGYFSGVVRSHYLCNE